MCHRSSLALFLQGSTILVHISPVCPSTLPIISFHPFSTVTISQVMNFSLCDASIPVMPSVHAEIPRFILGATLLILAVTQTFKESVNMYRATQQWQPNRYLKRLARDGIIYFLVYVSVSSICHRLSGLLPPILLSNICRQTNHSVVSSRLLGTCCSIFLIYSNSVLQETTFGCSSRSCFLA